MDITVAVLRGTEKYIDATEIAHSIELAGHSGYMLLGHIGPFKSSPETPGSSPVMAIVLIFGRQMGERQIVVPGPGGKLS